MISYETFSVIFIHRALKQLLALIFVLVPIVFSNFYIAVVGVTKVVVIFLSSEFFVAELKITLNFRAKRKPMG